MHEQRPDSTDEGTIRGNLVRRYGASYGGYVALDVGAYGGARGGRTVLWAGGCTAPRGCGIKQRLRFLKFGLDIGPIGPSGLWVRDGADWFCKWACNWAIEFGLCNWDILMDC
ncbi:uncharacterized protein LOC128293732 [Gossypium arboreum]|uniref:uncharacterized protein LOC128293732 n=1 Tax=Gossypium arboreum TaxID=29729 RepID=UPI0022F17FB8|nr:uncharacterized protein LOC128293732 [Gossypium arboreum]